MNVGLPQSLRALSHAWLIRITPPRRRATMCLAFLIAVAALLVARAGSFRSRAVAIAFFSTFAVAALVVRKREREVWKDPKRTLSRIAVGMPELGARATRALSLLDRSEGEGTSPELAVLHVERAVAALPQDKIEATAGRYARLYGAVAFLFAAFAFGLFVWNPWGLVEGADVLFARDGRAPMPLIWLVDLDVIARPPDYLHDEERRVGGTEAQLANGSLITVRGTPVHDGRRLFLSDGHNEVPLVDDGTGKAVARWPLSGDSTLRVLARFGDVVIEEPRQVQIHAIMDESPVVRLEGAPRKIQLTDPDPTDIEIRYEATDDHALREVHLVFRSAGRDERRVLARVEGETKRDSGGYVVRLSDPFLKKSHAPIEITVEAKDNDPVTGPKWGMSEAITVIPPHVGEPEAQRLDALRHLRDVLVDGLAYRLSHDPPTPRTEREAFLEEERRWTKEASLQLDRISDSTFSGARLAGRLQTILRGQERKFAAATEAELRAPNAASHNVLVRANERYLLVVDAMMAGLAKKDAREVSLKLAEIADELAANLGYLDVERGRSESERTKATLRVVTTADVLRGGGKALLRLGSLGRDIGEIVDAYLLRVERARQANDAAHAILAAQDLSARLHQPDPSFGSKGSARGGGGGESGGGDSMPSEGDGEGSDVERAFNEAAQDLERLAEDHAGNIGKVEQALSSAESDEDAKAFKEEGKKHAEAVRQAIKKLPSLGGGSDTWTGKGSLGREHAEQMARSLEQGRPADAVSAGQNALQALEEARRLASRDRWDRGDSEATVEDARRKIEVEQRWAMSQLEALRKKASERARGDLEKRAEDESKLAERARALGEKGRNGESMPEAAVDALESAERLARGAAEALKQGNADRALEEQRKAQQKLESAKQAMSGESEGGRSDEADKGPRSKEHADIPNADAHKGPEEFRRRVMKGLGQSGSGRERDAVKRYAEGLLR